MQLMCDRVGIISNGKLLGVKPIQELMSDASNGTFYRFMMDDTDKGFEILQGEYKDKIREKTEKYIQIETTKEEVPSITKLLAMNDISIFGVNAVESSLEDAFSSITGGGNSIE